MRTHPVSKQARRSLPLLFPKRGVVLLCAAILGAACGDDPDKRPVGSPCGEPEECQSGVCFAQRCIDVGACGDLLGQLAAAGDGLETCAGALSSFTLEPADAEPSPMGDLRYQTWATLGGERFEATAATVFSSSDPSAVIFDPQVPGIALFALGKPGRYTISARLGSNPGRTATAEVTIPGASSLSDTGDASSDASDDASFPEVFSDVGPDATEVDDGPLGLTVFFASFMDFATTLTCSMTPTGTRIVGTGAEGTFTIVFAGSSVGTYPCDDATSMSWLPSQGTERDTNSSRGGACSIQITRYGAVGERIEGSFSGMMNTIDSGDPFSAVPFNSTLFSVIRGPDTVAAE